MASKLTLDQLAHYSESKQGSITGALVLILCSSNLSVAIRFAAQLRIYRRIFAEDYLLAFAVLCSNIVIALLFVAAHYGLGLHVYRVVATDPDPPGNLVSMFKHIWITAVLNGPCFLSIKLSLLFFYRRIFLVNQRWLRIFWWINLVYAILWFVGSTVDFIFQCVPAAYYWERTYLKFPNPQPSVHGECHASENWQIALPIVFSAISDFALLGLPIVTLTRLHMSNKQKAALLSIFSLGLLACFLEVARIIIITVATDVQDDPSYNTVAFLILSSAGEGAAIMCACLPLIAAQLKSPFERFGVCCWRTRPNFKATQPTNRPIRLTVRRNSRAGSKRRGEFSSNEQLHTGTQTVIEAAAENESGIGSTNQIRVKTDLEWEEV